MLHQGVVLGLGWNHVGLKNIDNTASRRFKDVYNRGKRSEIKIFSELFWKLVFAFFSWLRGRTTQSTTIWIMRNWEETR